MRRFSPPSYFGGLPELAEDILRKALGDIADRIDGLEPAVDPAVETSELIMTPGAPRRITPPSSGARAILPAPDGSNAGQGFSMLVESPVGSVTVSALPGRDAGGQSRDTTINGQPTFTASTEGLVTFVSNGVDRYLTHVSGGSGSGSGSGATDTPGTTVVARTLGYPGSNDNLTLRVNNSILARIAGRLVSLVANENDVLRRVASGALEFGQLVTSNLGDSIVTVAKQADVAQHTIRGKFTGGTGNLEDKAISSLLGSGLSYDTGTGVISATGGGGSGGQYVYGDTTHSPLLLINGDTELVDQSGNGYDATNLVSSTHGVCQCSTGQPVISVGAGSIISCGLQSGLWRTGDTTVVWMGMFTSEATTTTVLLACGGLTASETAANNMLYSLRVLGSARPPRRLNSFWEYGASGTNETNSTSANNGSQSVQAHGHMTHLAMVRDGATGLRLYIDGILAATYAGLNAATGGANAYTTIGAHIDDACKTGHYLFSTQIIPSALSDAQILALYNTQMGPVHGTKS